MLEAKVAAFLERHSFTLVNKKLVIGVSGGPDSLGLLHYMWSQRKKKNLSIVAAHVDHMFRGQQSLEDALFVQSFCEARSIPFEMTRINVPEIIQQTKGNSQTEARKARYRFFEKIMEKYQHEYLVLGHHGDDQMETILMRLTRGSTGSARAGISFLRPFASGVIFRPFLSLTKREIEEYCAQHQITPRLDPSNEKDVYSRNRFRKQVLPFLKAENPNVHDHFQRFSEDLIEDEILLQELTVQKMNKVMKTREKNKIIMDINEFLQVPIPLQRRGIQLILNYLYHVKPAALSALHIDQIFSLIQHPHPSGKLDFPGGLNIIRSYTQLSFQFDEIHYQTYYFELAKPGLIELPTGACIEMDIINKETTVNHPCFAVFPADKVPLPVKIRTRKTADRMSLKGMSGTKKLKDIFIDSKVPLQERDRWPVITDGKDEILWLPGLKKANHEGIDPTICRYILITYHK